MPVIPALLARRQKDGHFQASLGYIVNLRLKKADTHKRNEQAKYMPAGVIYRHMQGLST